jgi:hypothetical protein
MKSSAPFLLRLGMAILVILGSGSSALATQEGPNEDYGFYEGIAIYREYVDQPDESAIAFRYHTYEDLSSVMSFDVGKASPVNLPAQKVVAMVKFQEFHLCDLLNGGMRAELESYRQTLLKAIKRYPSTRPYLKGIIDRLEACLKQFDSGQVRYNGKWMSPDAYRKLEQSERAEYEKREAVAKRVAAEVAERNRVAAEEKAKRVKAEAEETATRERNLRSTPATIAGQFLMKNYDNFAGNVKWRVEKGADAQGTAMKLPEKIIQGAAAMPAIGPDEPRQAQVGLREGVTPNAPAVLFARTSLGCIVLRLAVVLKLDGDTIVNADEIQGALRMLSQADPAVADWFLLGIVSARAKIKFQRNVAGKGGIGRVLRQFGSKLCDVYVTEPALFDDGSFYSTVCISVVY